MQRKIKLKYYFAAFAAIEAVLVLLLLFFMNTTKNETLSRATNQLRVNYQSVFSNFSLIGHSIYCDISSRPEILKIISDANSADKNGKTLLRNNLYNMLSPFYEKLKDLDVVQLHFHLSDGTTFLRFNKPGLYDDYLKDARYSINFVLRRKVPVEGFEHGLYFSAFRYVFPIFKDNVFVGSFETSVHFSGFEKSLFMKLPAEYVFMVNKESINKKPADSTLHKYTQNYISDDFLIEPSDIGNNCYASLKRGNTEKILRMIKPNVAGILKRKLSFSRLLKFDDKYYIISFLPILSTEKHVDAYLLSVSENRDIKLYEDFFLRLVAGTLILILIISLLYINNKTIKHKKIIESDLKFLQLFLETIPHPVFFTDYNGKVMGCNKEFADIVRVRRRDIINHLAHEILPEELYNILSIKDTELLNNGTKQIYEARITYSDGKIHDVIVVKAQVVSKSKGYGIVGSLLDVTEHKRIEQMLVNNARMASMGELITAIAHNWRQPINEIALTIGDIEDAFEFGQLDKAYLRESVQSAMSTLHSISDTISEFRTFYKHSDVLEEFDVGSAVEDTLKKFTEAIESLGIKCKVKLLENVKVKGYESEFKQVFLSILNNAKDAIMDTALNDNIGNIEITMSTESNKVAVSVADDGGGIPERVLNRIFDPYFTTKMQGKGIGMGLYLGKIIIEHKMKGRLFAHNADGGAVFTIELQIT
ncbi:MAG: PAS domain S-box protein [Nitrospirae bacterium]|nr:PAS domain S-box protein [Nitrospirota bacterium]MBF0536537.1 PAS domain S-box protein [Nitrospirota bacterium]MBF0616624.1 PAS domain S-box protein [Nitrospirota bacterium]